MRNNLIKKETKTLAYVFIRKRGTVKTFHKIHKKIPHTVDHKYDKKIPANYLYIITLCLLIKTVDKNHVRLFTTEVFKYISRMSPIYFVQDLKYKCERERQKA